ncbi:MAG TPA: DHHW family protein [Cytophagaceae bacterium]|nr:DHHW family protein [Cytophagaceae bacterium]
MTDATQNTDDQATTKRSWVIIVAFVAIIILGGFLSLVIPKKKISETEKRMLCPFPTFTSTNLFSGNYADSLELYYADNFPFRETLVQLASSTKNLYGYRADDVMIYNIEQKDEQAVKVEKPGATQKMDTISVDSITVAQLDSMVVLDTMKNEGEYVKSVFIYGGRAFQIFGGTSNTAKSFASMVNKYEQTLGEEVKFYCMEIPTPIDYYLPAKYKNKNNYEKKNIDLLYAALDSGVVRVHAFEEMQKHTDEYLFFNTDHHWTGRGAYYAYRAFCEAAGLKPYELSQLERKTKKKFLGSFYGLTHDKRLKENIDSVEYFKLPIATKAWYYMDAKFKKGASTKLFAEIASGGNSYSVFLGGDYPLMKVTTPNKTGRKIMIIKDSFGNAFAPLLALHYDEVYIADYRYFNTNIPDFIKQNNITDFVFAHNTFVVNTRYSVVRETALLKSYRGPAVLPKKVIVDSLAAPADTLKK